MLVPPLPNTIGQCWVVCRQHATEYRCNLFADIQTEQGNITFITNQSSLPVCPKGMGTVLHHPDLVPKPSFCGLYNFTQLAHIQRITEQMRGNNGPCILIDCPCKLLQIHVVVEQG